MILKRFSRLKNCGIFGDFQWVSSLSDFGRFNLIYGWNGSGKTTLSKILRDLQKAQSPVGEEVRLLFEEQQLNGTDFLDAEVPVRVFNRDFVEENIFRSDRGELPPIFVLGEESTEKQMRVEELKTQIEIEQSELRAATAAWNQATRNLENHGSAHALNIKGHLRSPGDNKDNPYSNYNRPDYISRASQMAEEGKVSVYVLGDQVRERLQAQLTENPKLNIEEVDFSWPELASQIQTVTDILEDSVVSDTIQKLKENSELSDWVHDGLGLHRKMHTFECLFCEQLIPQARLSQLESHFNDSFSALMGRIDEAACAIGQSKEDLSELDLPNKEKFYDTLAPEYEEAEAKLRETVLTIQGLQESLLGALEGKRQEPFERMKKQFNQPDLDPNRILRLNSVIKQHNEISDNYKATVDKARKTLESHWVASTLTAYLELNQQIERELYRILHKP